MFLAVDIGNTNVVVGAFDKNKLVKIQRFPSDAAGKLKRINGSFDAAFVASVVPLLNSGIAKQIEAVYGIRPRLVTHKDIKGVTIGLKNKEQVGVDRLVNALAAVRLYGCPAIVIDLGTATTFCVVSKGGIYKGGAITSGLAISRDVLHEKTAKLPYINIDKPSHVIGRDTVEAMKSGLFFGYIDMIEGMVKRFKKELKGNPIVIATGGLSKVISSGTKVFDVVDMDLTLKGLNIVYNDIKRC